jgi:hypothetical protein
MLIFIDREAAAASMFIYREAASAIAMLFYALVLVGLTLAAGAALGNPRNTEYRRQETEGKTSTEDTEYRRMNKKSKTKRAAHSVSCILSPVFCRRILSPVFPGDSVPRPEETVWLTRFALTLFAAWVGAYGFSNYGIYLNDAERLRYLLPIYPVLVAAFCYALTFLPGVAKWLAVLPFLTAGFGALCHTAVSPASSSSWQELNAQRGDSYVYFITRPGGSWPDAWGGPEPAFGALPRRWRDFAWLTYGGGQMPVDQAKRWRRNPDDFASQPVSLLIAEGRGEVLGIRLCNDGRYGEGDFPATAMGAATAAAYFTGIGFGCLQVARDGPRCEIQRINWPPREAKTEFGPERTCRPADAREALRAAQEWTGLTPRQTWEAFLRGAAMYLGITNQPPAPARREKFCQSWAAVFGVDAAECPNSLREGLAEGEAILAMNHFREVNIRPDAEISRLGYRGSAADWPAVREVLRGWGVDAAPVGDTGLRYALRFAD